MKKVLLFCIFLFLVSLFISLDDKKPTLLEDALADGTCCREWEAVCVIGGVHVPRYYYRGAGSCASDDEDEDEE